MKKILLIEDDTNIRETIAEMLTVEEFDVLEAENGQEGTALAVQQSPDLIICDIMMPEVDGYQVLNQLRKQEETAIIPFIFLTAKVTNADVRYGMELGADAYLPKPFTRDSLLNTIFSRLQKQETLLQHYLEEAQTTQNLKKQLQAYQELSELQAEVIDHLKYQLRNFISKITMVAHLLNHSPPDKQDQYLQILKADYAKELQLLNELDTVQQFIQPKDLASLRRYNLLNKS